MKKRLQILIGVGAVLVISIFIYWDNQTGHKFVGSLSLEPTYEGHTFTYWMHQWGDYPWGGAGNVETTVALQSMGPKAAPYLVQWIKIPPTEGLNFNFPEYALKGFEVLGPVAKPAVPGLIKIIGLNRDYPERALLCIGRDAVPPLADKLLETLSDTNNPFYQGAIRTEVRKSSGYFIRGRILSVFDRMGTNAEAALPALVITASTNLPPFRDGLYDENPYMTLAVVGKNHPEIVVPVLLKKFATSENDRSDIVRAMAFFGTNQADAFLPVLVASLSENKTNDWSRFEIGEALTVMGHTQPDRLVPVFLAAMTNQNNFEQIRCAMAGYLAKVGHDQPDVVLPALMTAYTNASLYGRSSIAGALATFGKQAGCVVPLLLTDCQREIKPHNDNGWRIQLAIAAKTIAPENHETLAPLFKDLESPAMFVRQQTISALGRLGTNGLDAVPALLNCLSNANTQTRIDATEALNNIGVTSDAFTMALGENLSCPNSFMAGDAESTLGKLAMNSKLAFVTLIKKGVCGGIGRDESQQARWALVNISRADPKFMLECLDDSDADVRLGALMVFYDLERGVPQSIPKLREMAANDPDAGVRRQATNVLQLQLQ